MFHQDFYPTPEAVIYQMIMPVDIKGRVFLEPSAGSGNIVDFLRLHEAKDIVACEIEPRLQAILRDKCTLIADDFLTVESWQVSHVNCIIMNPPFSTAKSHILHAWSIAPEGCEIIALCNYDTAIGRWAGGELHNLINEYGSITDLGNCFANSERPTNVQIGLIRLYKPIVSEEFDYEGFFLEEENIDECNTAGIMRRDEVRAIVDHYVRAARAYDLFEKEAKKLEGFLGALGASHWKIVIEASCRNKRLNKLEFLKDLRVRAWHEVFGRLNLEKYVTTHVMEDINRFVKQQYHVPFSVRNVYRMLEIIVGTMAQTMNRSIESAIDNLTKYTDKNRYGVEGWKTNSGHCLNKKFICNYGVDFYFGKARISYDSKVANQINDLLKALCYIQGLDFDYLLVGDRATWDRENPNKRPPSPDIYQFFSNNTILPGKWYDFAFFEFKAFLKGSIHFKFKDEKVWEALNRAYAKIKGGALPEKI